MSLAAVIWAKNDAPVEKLHLLAVLYALADHASEDGTGAWPSQTRLAYGARCDVRTVRRHLSTLEDQGLILRGDQQLVSHLPADRRPVVYDLNLALKREQTYEQFLELENDKRAKERERRAARKAEKSKKVAPPMDATPSTEMATTGQSDLPQNSPNTVPNTVTVGHSLSPRPDTGGSHGRTQVSYKPPLNQQPKPTTYVCLADATHTPDVIDAEIVEETTPAGQIELIPAPALPVIPDLPAVTPAPTRPSNRYTPEFETWWSYYPKRVDKMQAFTAWEKVLQDPDSPTAPELIHHCQRYAAFGAATSRERRYTLLPTTWLRKRRWEDELTIQSNDRMDRHSLNQAYMATVTALPAHTHPQIQDVPW